MEQGMRVPILRKCTLVWILLGVLALVAPIASASPWDQPRITAMTRNLYLGADIFRLVEAAENPASIPYVVAEVYQTMLYTNFWARAEAIADEMARNKPDVIGLQEVSTFYIQTPGDFMDGNPKQAETVVIDFYLVLDAALKARGMKYQAFKVTNADVELPMFDPSSSTYLSDVRLVDHDYILIRKGHPATEVLAGNYHTNVGLEIGGRYVEFIRGYLAVDVEVRGNPYRFVNTHLEVNSSPGSVFRIVQSYQMLELLAALKILDRCGSKPVIMVGDFNSSPVDVPGFGYHPVYERWLPYIPPYRLATAAGYRDSWLLQSSYDEGYTSGFDEYVSDPTAQLTTRIDLIFLDRKKDLAVQKVSCDLVGEEVTDMIPNPAYPGEYLWPSDHAGVVANIQLRR